MLVSDKGIVFHTLRYGDTSLIARIYTRQMGLQSFLIKGVKNGRGTIRPSHLLPLNLIELVYNNRQNRGLQSLKELKCEPVLQTVHSDPVKRSIVLFLSELVNRSVQEEEGNPDLFGFIWNKVQMLDLHDPNGLQLFPQHFALQLTRYLGFYPSDQYRDGDCLDLPEGLFCRSGTHSAHFLDPVTSALLHRLCISNFEEVSRWKIVPVLRKSLLDGILRYYRLHLEQFRDLQSPEILHEVFSV